MLYKFVSRFNRSLILESAKRKMSFNVSDKKIGIVGVPFGRGQSGEGNKVTGLERAPDVIRKSSLFQELRGSGFDVKDYGNVSYTALADDPAITSMFNFSHVIANSAEVSQAVSQVLTDGRRCFTIGGDHSMATGTIHGHLQVAGSENVAVVYIDAHADINTSSSSPSGNIHGMCVAMASKELEKEWADFPEMAWIKHRLPLSSIGYIGLRSVDPGEAKVIVDNDVSAFYMNDVTRLGIAEVVKRTLNKIDPDNKKSIHLSIDTDSLDPSEAPSTTCPVRGGLLLREMLYIVDEIHKTGRMRVLDWVELNPLIGTEADVKKTVQAATETIKACYGLTLSCGNFEDFKKRTR